MVGFLQTFKLSINFRHMCSHKLHYVLIQHQAFFPAIMIFGVRYIHIFSDANTNLFSTGVDDVYLMN